MEWKEHDFRHSPHPKYEYIRIYFPLQKSRIDVLGSIIETYWSRSIATMYR